MSVRKETERDYAKLLFIEHGLFFKDIAVKVKVTEKTIGKWASDGKWAAQKKSLLATRTNIIDNLTEQIELLQLAINKRDDKMASSKETDQLIKLAGAIKKLETDTGLGETISIVRDFINFTQTINFEISKTITDYADMFINAKMR